MSKSFFSAVAFALLTSVSAGSYAATEVTPVAATPAVAFETTAVNLNSADIDTLARELNGIGEAKARAIVAYRDAHGPFSSIDELLEVKGIGAATLEKNRAKLSLK